MASIYVINGELVVKAIPGFEHLFPLNFGPSSQTLPPSPSLSPFPGQDTLRTDQETTNAQHDQAIPQKRPYSEAEMTEKPRQKSEMPAHQFYMGDMEGLKKFYRVRLGEIGINALRRIITEWIKVLEPTRLRSHGPYHKLKEYGCDSKLLSTEISHRGHGPPWWPRTVPYVEPAHLPSKCMRPMLPPVLSSLIPYTDSVNCRPRYPRRGDHGASVFIHTASERSR